jgi:hypothetical protein
MRFKPFAVSIATVAVLANGGAHANDDQAWSC